MRIVAGVLVVLALAVPALADDARPYVRTCSSSAYGDLGQGWRENAIVAGRLAFVGLGGPRRSVQLDPVDRGRANPLKVLVVVEPGLVARAGCVRVDMQTQGTVLRRTLRFGVPRCG